MTAVVVSVGPVDVEAARAWVDHELRNLGLLRAGIDKLPFDVPVEILDEIESHLREWKVVADRPGPFRWEAVFERHRLEHLVRYWANLDVLTDELVERLGLAWAPLSTRPFFDALVAGVGAALEGDPYVRLLAR